MMWMVLSAALALEVFVPELLEWDASESCVDVSGDQAGLSFTNSCGEDVRMLGPFTTDVVLDDPDSPPDAITFLVDEQLAAGESFTAYPEIYSGSFRFWFVTEDDSFFVDFGFTSESGPSDDEPQSKGCDGLGGGMMLWWGLPLLGLRRRR